MINLTDGQKKTVACGITVLALTLVLAFAGALSWVVLRLFEVASSAFVPLFAGIFLALFFKPYYEWILKGVRNPSLALVLLFLTVLVPAGLFLWYAGAVVVDQIVALVNQAPSLVRHVTDWFHATFPNARVLLERFGIDMASLGDFYASYGTKALKAGGGQALHLLGSAVTVLVSLVFFVFFLMTRPQSGREIAEHLPILKPETRAFFAELYDAFFDILVSFFQRQTVICLIEGVFYGTGFALVGLPYGFLIGFALGALNLIPLFGSVACLPIALPLAFFGPGGSVTRLLLVLAVWGTGQLLDGYLITPRIQGNKTGLGYAGVIFSFVFWSSVLGPMMGMLLAIPLSAFCVVLWRAVKSRYVRPIV